MSNKDFVWTDELVVAFTSWSLTKSPTFQGRYADIEQFKSERHQPQKEWEIMTLLIDGVKSYRNSSGVFYPNISTNTEEELLKNGGSIFAVRRTSDNVVFKVGDEVCSIKVNFGYYKISSFIIKPDGIMADLSNHGCVFLEYLTLKPNPQPLFTTEDGKPVYEGGECWVVEKGEDYPYQWVQVVKEGMEDGFTLFSTKDAAKEWVLMNKPCLSVNDVMGVFRDIYEKEGVYAHPTHGIVRDYLIELAKTKINQ